MDITRTTHMTPMSSLVCFLSVVESVTVPDCEITQHPPGIARTFLYYMSDNILLPLGSFLSRTLPPHTHPVTISSPSLPE